MRKVVDFRGLNKLCVTDAYPLPLMDQLLDELSASEYMGATDLKSGYWQVPVHEDSCDKLAFITNFGLFQYRRTPMGYKNAPAHFMREVDTLLMSEGIRENNATYVDDVTTHGRSFEDYIEQQKRLFAAMETHHWLAAADKLRLGYK